MGNAKNMTNQERSKKASEERWNPTIPKASHSGILNLGNLSIPCAIVKMPSGEILRLITQTGMLKALGRKNQGLQKEGARDLPVFVTADNLKPFITNDIIAAGKQVEFRLPNGGKAFGYKAELLAMICGVYLDAEREGKILPQQKNLAKVCHILQKAFSTIGLISLVDEVCGYQKIRDSDALQKILEKYLNSELAKWASRFPPEFYKEIYRLKNWAWNSATKTKYSVVGYYTKDLVYERLAPGLLQEMERVIPRTEEGDRKGRLHQLLTEDYGIPKLKEHFSALLAIMKLSKNWEDLISNVNLVLPKKVEFEEKNIIHEIV